METDELTRGPYLSVWSALPRSAAPQPPSGLVRPVQSGESGPRSPRPQAIAPLRAVGSRRVPQVPRRGTCKGACPGEANGTTPGWRFNDAFNDAAAGFQRRARTARRRPATPDREQPRTRRHGRHPPAGARPGRCTTGDHDRLRATPAAGAAARPGHAWIIGPSAHVEWP